MSGVQRAESGGQGVAYPTMNQVEEAGLSQIERWLNKLHIPSDGGERVIYNRIEQRFCEMTPDDYDPFDNY